MKTLVQTINESKDAVMNKQLDMIVKTVNNMLSKEDVDVVVYELLDAISENGKDNLIVDNIKAWAEQY
jgi:hypothetical protein